MTVDSGPLPSGKKTKKIWKSHSQKLPIAPPNTEKKKEV